MFTATSVSFCENKEKADWDGNRAKFFTIINSKIIFEMTVELKTPWNQAATTFQSLKDRCRYKYGQTTWCVGDITILENW
jgi:hypothetical protein